MIPSAFPPDGKIPGIALAVDPMAMRELFGAELRAVSGNDYRIDDCRMLRIRHRVAEHFIAQYELAMIDTRTGRRRDAWLSGVIYPDDRARDKWKRLCKACAEDPDTGWARAFGPAFYVPAANMLAQAFPCDRRLPGLAKVVGRLPRELESILLRAFGDGQWRVERCKVEPVRYRPHLGAVVRYTVEARDAAAGRHAERTFFVKVYRDTAGERTCRVLSEIRERSEATGQPFTVVEPVGYSSGLRALVLEKAPGISLEQIILYGRDAEGAARQTARAIAAFHRNAVVPVRCRSPNDVVAEARGAANYIGRACPHLTAEVESIMRAIRAGLKQVTPSPAHLDFKPDHVFLDGERVVFVDLDCYGEADPVLDAAVMLARLQAMPIQFDVDPSRTGAVARAFKEEYFGQVSDEWCRRLPVNYACAALRLACGFFQRQHPRWAQLVPAWVARAGDAAAGRLS